MEEEDDNEEKDDGDDKEELAVWEYVRQDTTDNTN